MSQSNNDLIHEEALHEWIKNDSLITTTAASLHGPPEIKKEEKKRFLGEYRERVIKALTQEQVLEDEIFPEIKKAFESEKADKLIINGSIKHQDYRKYEELSKNYDIKTTISHNPNFVGNVGLIVASNNAVNKQDIFIERENPIVNSPSENSKTNNYKKQSKQLSEISFIEKFKNFVRNIVDNKNKV